MAGFPFVSEDVGTKTDSAWGGSGNGTLVSIGKAIANILSSIGSSTTPVSVTLKNGTGAYQARSAGAITTLTAGQVVYSSSFVPSSEIITFRMEYFQSGSINFDYDTSFFWLENDPNGTTNYSPISGTKTMFSSLPRSVPGIAGGRSPSCVANFQVRGGNSRIGVYMGTPTGTASGATGFNFFTKD